MRGLSEWRSAMSRSRLYRDGVLEAEDIALDDVGPHTGESGVTVWLDLCGPTPEELAVVGEKLGLHELAVEGAASEHQRPKLDRYEGHLFVNVYAVRLDPDDGRLETSEIAVFVAGNVVVTVRKNEQFDMDAVLERWDASPDLAQYGVGFLLHGLLDYVVDGHFAAVQVLDDALESLEDTLFSDKPGPDNIQRRSFALRKSLVLLRRVVLPMREVVNALMRRDLGVVEPPMIPYYQDVYDHVLRATEWTESLRDLVTTILETRLTIQGNRLNGIMKKVTSWAAIIAVPTAITGFYGQNVPYPGYGEPSGFYISTAITVLMSVGLFVFFRRHDWI
jgi:magnesium transporter